MSKKKPPDKPRRRRVDDPLPPEQHDKPIQPDTDLTLGHGRYVDDDQGQEQIWQDASTPDDQGGA